MRIRISLLLILCCCMILSGCQQSVPSVSYDNVADLTQEANELYTEGSYKEALAKYTEALKLNPIDMDSQLGMVECQIALNNYSLAATNLSAAVKVNPTIEKIYELYIELSKASENLSYARTAVSLATTHNIESFLSKVPEAPVIDTPAGSYDSALEVRISAADGSEIHVTEIKDSSTSYDYADPIKITRGRTTLTAYSIKDGIPSETVSAQYNCDYPPIEITFSDPVIEMLVRGTLDKPTEPITDVDCEEVRELNQYDLYRNMNMDWSDYYDLQIESLSDLTYFPNLQYLSLENLEHVTDFSPIAQCKHIYNLDISNSNLEDISFVESLPNLNYFYAYGNRIQDLSPLIHCKNLDSVYVDGNPVNDLTVLKDLDLTYLSFSVSQMQDLTLLKSWPNLEYIDINECGGVDLSSLSFLAEMPNLRSLYLSARNYTTDDETPLGDYSFVQNITQLERLNLNGLADYSQMDVVKSLKNLTYLYFRTMDYETPPNELVQDLQRSLPKCEISV